MSCLPCRCHGALPLDTMWHLQYACRSDCLTNPEDGVVRQSPVIDSGTSVPPASGSGGWGSNPCTPAIPFKALENPKKRLLASLLVVFLCLLQPTLQPNLDDE